MTNDQMKQGRFLRWHQARQKAAKIAAHLNAGGKVVVGTCTRATAYSRKHADMFKATRAGLFVQAGRRWVCIDFATIRLA